MSCRQRLAFAFTIVVFGSPPVAAQEVRVTRETLVATVERAPGSAKGCDDAPVTVVEFSDFQCSFCRKFWKETLPRIEAEYTETGKVRFLYRHFVALGPASAGAAEAAECAGEQGKFWPYHDLLFERAGAFAEGKLKAYAGELGLEPKAFDACLASGRHQERIVAESSIARSLGASGTPAFLVNGRLLIGAHPFSTFKAILDAALARVSEKASVGRSTSPPAAPASKP
jgi:protein-disulfide isomerase